MYCPNAMFNPRANCSTCCPWGTLRIRIGLAVRYISPDVVQQGRSRDMVLLARGRDDYGYFAIVAPPLQDLPFGESTVHSESLARRTRNVLPAGAGSKR